MACGDQVVESFLARRLGQADVDGELAAEDRLDAAGEIADNAARAHGYPPHQSHVAQDPVTGDIVGCGDEHWHSPVCVDREHGRAWPSAQSPARVLSRGSESC